MEKLILSPFTILEKKDDRYLIFNKISLSVLEINKKLYDFLINLEKNEEITKLPENILENLISKNIVVQKSFDEKKELNKINTALKKEKIKINSYRLLLTEKCNFACKYCFVNLQYKDNIWGNIEKAIELLIKNNKNEKISIQFFGGEPLIKFDYIKKVVNLIKKKGDKLLGVNYAITTNGSLITDEIAKYFYDNKFRVGISLDGPKEINDINRIYKNGKGTYFDAVRGFLLLKKQKVNNFILLTPTQNNIENLNLLVKYIITTYRPNSLTINMPQHNYGWGIDGKKFSDEMKKIILYASKNKINITSPVAQILDALTNKNQILRTCTYGSSIANASITVDGRITYCPINYNKSLFPKSILDIKTLDFKEANLWYARTSIDDEICRDCIAVATCGGICPMQSLEKYGKESKIKHDVEKCKFFKDFTKWALFNY